MTQPRRPTQTALKVVITGPFGAGKTTMISAISEIEVVSTESGVSDSTRSVKNETTVAMDFGRLTIDPELVLYLFGTPGQERFDFMWDVLSEGMLGFIVLVDATRAETLQEAAQILSAFQKLSGVPFVIGVNKTPEPTLDPASEEAVRLALDLSPSIRVVAVDVRERESVKQLLLSLCHAVADTLEPLDA